MMMWLFLIAALGTCRAFSQAPFLRGAYFSGGVLQPLNGLNTRTSRKGIMTSHSSNPFTYSDAPPAPPDSLSEVVVPAPPLSTLSAVPSVEASSSPSTATLDKRCDAWFKGILGDVDPATLSFRRPVYEQLTAAPKLYDMPEGYGEEKHPSGLAFGCETFNIPIIRKKAEAFRQFDVEGLVKFDFKSVEADDVSPLTLSPASSLKLEQFLENSSHLLPRSSLHSRLVYINGRYAPSLSFTPTPSNVYNVMNPDLVSPTLQPFLTRLPDGYTDILPNLDFSSDPSPPSPLAPLSVQSGVVQWMGPANCQFAVNTQQGTASFDALNLLRLRDCAVVDFGNAEGVTISRPVQIANLFRDDDCDYEYVRSGADNSWSSAVVAGGGVGSLRGKALHPRLVVRVGENTALEVIQSFASVRGLTETGDVVEGRSVDGKRGEADPAPLTPLKLLPPPLFINSCSQLFLGKNASLQFDFLEEYGGASFANVSSSAPQRAAELRRPTGRDSILASIDTYLAEKASCNGTVFSIGSSGRSRVSSAAKLCGSNSATVFRGLTVASGCGVRDVFCTNHHLVPACYTSKKHRTIASGRSKSTFRGRIRVEQDAQRTVSEMLLRCLLLTDNCETWQIPTLEVVADDVQVNHGVSVGPLPDEEVFYMRARGIAEAEARSMQLMSFATEVTDFLKNDGLRKSLMKRIRTQMEIAKAGTAGVGDGIWNSI